MIGRESGRAALSAALLLSLAAQARAEVSEGVILKCQGPSGGVMGGAGVVRLSPTRLEAWDAKDGAFHDACADRAPLFDPADAQTTMLRPGVCQITPSQAHITWSATEPARIMGQVVTLRRDIRLDLDASAGQARETVSFDYLGLNDYDDRRVLTYACAPASAPK